jgi:hypothetical protein
MHEGTIDLHEPSQYLQLNGNLASQSTGELRVGIKDANANHAAVKVAGSAQLAGNLIVSLTEDHQIKPSDRCEILSAASVIGTFDNAPSNGEVRFDRPGAPANARKAGFDVAYQPGPSGGVTLTNFRTNVTHLISVGVDWAGDATDARLAGNADEFNVYNAFGKFLTNENGDTRAEVPLSSTAIGNSAILLNRIADAERTVMPGDTFILYVSTHGLGRSDDEARRRGLPVPGPEPLKNIVIGTTSAPSTQNEVLRTGQSASDEITDDELTQAFDTKTWNEVNKLIIFDSCYSGGFKDDLERLPRLALLAAATEEQLSFSFPEADPEYGEGVFTRALIDVLDATPDVEALTFERLALALQTRYAGQVTGYPRDLDDSGNFLATGVAEFAAYSSSDFRFGAVIPEPSPSFLSLALCGLLPAARFGRQREGKKIQRRTRGE